jgi:zinc protease
VQARLVLRFGDEKSLFKQDTVAALLGATLDKGAAGLARQQISDGFDKLRAEVGFNAQGQSLLVSISTVRENLPAVVTLLGRVLRTPTLPADALEEARRQALTGIERQRKEPGAVISNALDRLGNPYPRGDLRYESTFDEAVQDVQAVTAEQLRAFHRNFYSAANAEFAAVGDLDAPAVKAALQQAFGDWKQPAAGPRAFTRVPRPLMPVPAQRLVLATPDKANASFKAVLPLPLNDTHPDYPALQLANFIFGSGGSGRLWKRIRETEGLSYGVGSAVDWAQTDLHSRWTSDAIFAPQNLARVEAAWRAELARSVQEGFTQAELDEARGALLNMRRLGRAQDAAIAGQLVRNLYLGRQFTLSQQVDDALAAVTLEQVNAAWRRYIDPTKIATAWGGDFKTAP